MNFEAFRLNIERILHSIAAFELQEFTYAPYKMGYSHVAYRIKGEIHKFVYDPRDNLLYWYKGKPHQKYSHADLREFKRIEGLNIDLEDLKEGIKI